MSNSHFQSVHNLNKRKRSIVIKPNFGPQQKTEEPLENKKLKENDNIESSYKEYVDVAQITNEK